MKNGLVDQPVSTKQLLSDSGRFWYTNMHKLTPNKETKAWRGRGLVDLVVTVRWWKTPLYIQLINASTARNIAQMALSNEHANFPSQPFL